MQPYPENECGHKSPWADRCCDEPLARYYIHWHNNCVESIRWIAFNDDPDIRHDYSMQRIEREVEYYEHRALLHWCEHLRHMEKCDGRIKGVFDDLPPKVEKQPLRRGRKPKHQQQVTSL